MNGGIGYLVFRLEILLVYAGGNYYWYLRR